MSITVYNVSKACILFAILLSLFATIGTGQTLSDYLFSTQSGSFTQIKGMGGEISPALSGGSTDDGYFNALPLGFTFNYLGVNYSYVCASTNGYLILKSTATDTLTSSLNGNNLITSTQRPVVAPLWDDLLTPAGNFSYKTVGTPNGRMFIAEWLNVQWYYNGNTNVVSFQAMIYEGTGRIDFIYRQETNIPSGTVGASIGLSDVGTGMGNFISLDGPGTSPAASTISETATIVDRPATGQIYSFYRPVNGLVGWYPFKNGSLNDSSGVGNHGTNYGAVPAMDRFGRISNAYYFPGTNNYIDCGIGASITFTNAMTISAWIKPDTLAGRIISKRGSLGGYEIDIAGSNLRFGYNGYGYCTMNISAYVNRWIYVVATFDGTYSRLYVNAAGSSPVATPLIISDTSHLCIGKASWTNLYPFKGSIDDVRLYNRALTDAEILAFYQEGGYDPTLIAYYPFTNGILLDGTGNGNNGSNHKASSIMDRFGNSNSAYEFRKTDTSYIDCGNGASLNSVSTGLTMSVWVNLYADSIGRIISKTQYGVPTGGYEMGVSQHQLYFGFNNTAYTSATASAYIRRWIHLVGTYDGSTVKLFLNGQLVSTFAYAATIGTSNNNMLIGAMANKADPGFFTGAIDDIRIYNRALSDAEITSLFTEGGWSAPSVPQLQSIDFFGNTARLTWQPVGGTALWYHVYRGKDSTALSLIDSVSLAPSFDNTVMFDTVYYYRITAVDSYYRQSAISFAVRAQNTVAAKDFSRITYSDIASAPLTANIINGSNSVFNHIPKGQILLYQTKSGRLGKMQIVQYGYVIRIRWVTYQDASTVISQGSKLDIDGTFQCNLDVGSQVSINGDFFWNQLTSVFRTLEPRNGATFALYSIDSVFNPIAPANLRALAGIGQVGLKWYKNTESNFLQYKIYRKTGLIGLYSLINTTTGGVTDTTFTNSGLTNGQLYYYRITATDSTGLESGFSNVVNATPNNPPTITSISPAAGPVGTTVTITGTNFNTFFAQNVVRFGGMAATITDATTTSLTVIVPFGAMYGPVAVTTNGLTAYSSIPFVPSFASSVSIDATSFAPKSDLTTGTVPYSVTSGDLDGDGRADLIVANKNSNSISFYRNTSVAGNISFASRIDSTLSGQPQCVAVADIDGDGALDVLAANYTGTSLSVFRNISTSGTIALANQIVLSTGASSNSIAIGDIDGDGKPDIVTTYNSSSYVAVLRNLSTPGNISFAGFTTFLTASSPFSVAINDIDGDGKPDIVTANNTATNTVSVLRNTSTIGAISFAAFVQFQTGSYPQSVTVGDINEDNKPDVMTVSYNTPGSVSILRNTSSVGTISFATRVDSTTGPSPSFVTMGDMDGDGKPDLVAANGGTVSILKNMTTGGSVSFAQKVDFGTGSNPCSVVLCDLDNDGKSDISVANYSSNTVSILRNTVAPQRPLNVTAAADTGSILLQWNKINESRFLRYRIYMSPAPNANVLKDSTAAIEDTTKLISGLLGGTHYYFRVKAVDSSFIASAYSNEADAITLVPAPTLLYPSDGAIDIASADSVKWTPIAGATGYRIQISTAGDMLGGFTVDETVVNPVHWIGTSTPGQVLYWHVQAIVSGVYSSYSNIWSFTASSGSPSIYCDQTALDFGYVQISTLSLEQSYILDGSSLTPFNGSITVSAPSGFEISTTSGTGFTSSLTVPYSGATLAATTLYVRFIPTVAVPYGGVITHSGGGATSVNVAVAGIGNIPPTTPTILNVNPGSGQVTLKWNSNLNSDFHFYRLYYGTWSMSSQYIEETTGGRLDTVRTISYLTNGTTYYFRVAAVDSGGLESPYSSEVSTTPSADITPPNFTVSPYVLNTPVRVDASGNILSTPWPIVSATATDNESGMWKMQIAYRNTVDMQWSYSEVTGNSINYQLPSTCFASSGKPVGVSYRVGAWDNAGNVYWSPFASIDIQLGTQVVDQSPFNMPSASQFQNQTTAYRMISVPYNLTNKTPAGLLSNFGTHAENNVNYVRWRFEQYANGQYRDYNDISGLNIVTPGAAFFFIVRDGGYPLTVQGQNLVNASTFYTTGIQLQVGWNLVGNPYTLPYPIDSLEYSTGAIRQHAFYSGTGPFSGWDTTSASVFQIQPWRGIALYVNNAGTLKFPVTGQRTGSASPRVSSLVSNSAIQSENSGNWVLAINAYRSDIQMRCEGMTFGMAQGAQEGDDQYDAYLPPIVGDRNVAVYFKNADGMMMRDIRPVKEDGEVWEMKVVTGDEHANVKIDWNEKFSLPNPEFEAYIIDKDQKMAHNLKTVHSLEINSGNGVRNFHIVIGKKSFILQNNAGVDVTPATMKLYANFPNPFNPETMIRYAVPNASPTYSVTLKIYNVLGQEIATLVNEQQPTGYYEVRWNARNQSSGIYFYQLTLSDGQRKLQDIKKMVFMK